MRQTCYLGLSLLLIVALGAPAFSQQPAAPQPQAKTQAEYNAYKALYDEQNPQKKAELGEKFLIDFKESDFVGQSYIMVITAYVRAQNWAKVMETADTAATSAKADNKLKTFAYSNAMVAAQQTNNYDKTIEYGEKVLAIEPNDLNALYVVAITLPERIPAEEAAKKALMDKAAASANKALTVVTQTFGAPKPANVTDAQWSQAKAEYEGNLHATLGYVFLNTREFDKSISSFETALKSIPKDAIAHYRLGTAYQFQTADASKLLVSTIQEKNAAAAARADQVQIDELEARRQGVEQDLNEKRDKAINELATAVALGGVVAQPAREALTKLYQTKTPDGSTTGLDELIAQKKSQLGTP
jgi:tetratricopeptide (TPR) repeat protein